MASKAQYDAAAAALGKLARSMISKLNVFEQGPATKALSPDLLHQFAVAAVDAALAVPAEPSPSSQSAVKP